MPSWERSLAPNLIRMLYFKTNQTIEPCAMTSVHPLPPAQAFPSNNHTNAAPYINGHVRHDSAGPSHRSTHSASSGEGLSMRDTDKSRNINQIPARSRTQAEWDGASASRLGAANGPTNGNSLPSRPRGQLPRANTDHGPRARSSSGDGRVSEEHWEMRHGWEDEYNCSEILAKLNTVGGIEVLVPGAKADRGAADLLHVLHRQAPRNRRQTEG